MIAARILVGTALLIAGAAVQRPTLEARFIGNMAFAITDGTVTLMTDFPYESGYSRYMTYSDAEIRSGTATTLALITHRHRDHWEPSRFAKTNWKVAGPDDVTRAVPADRVVAVSPRFSFGSLTIEALATPHANIGHYSYIVNWHGRRMYFSGDTEATDSLIAARGLDAAFVSPWLYRSVLRQGARIDAKRVVIYHHQSDERVAECAAGCIQPRQGEMLRIE